MSPASRRLVSWILNAASWLLHPGTNTHVATTQSASIKQRDADEGLIKRVKRPAE